MAGLPLDGIRIIEFGFVIAGPLATRFLADFGAEVIRVESREALCAYRGGGAIASLGTEDPVPLRQFTEFNRNKRCITLNLGTKRGKDILRRLVRISDVFLDNYSTRAMRNWGLDYPALRQIKPDIIMVDMPGLGQSGPHGEYVTWGPNLSSITGMTYLWGHPEDLEPVGSQSAHPNYVAAQHAALATMAALHYRARTGKGQHIDLAQVEAAASLLGAAYLDYLMNGQLPEPLGNRSHYLAPHGCYRCQGEDRWCVISVQSDEEWRTFCHAIGAPKWVDDPRFTRLVDRLRNVDELDRLVEAWTIQHTPHEVMEKLQRVGVAAAAVQNGKDLCEDRHLRERGFLAEIEHPEAGRALTYPGITVGLSETPGTIRGRASLLGEDNDHVYGQLLGFTPKEIRALEEEGVLF